MARLLTCRRNYGHQRRESRESTGRTGSMLIIGESSNQEVWSSYPIITTKSSNNSGASRLVARGLAPAAAIPATAEVWKWPK